MQIKNVKLMAIDSDILIRYYILYRLLKKIIKY